VPTVEAAQRVMPGEQEQRLATLKQS